MKLYLLGVKNRKGWPTYDSAWGFVVRAEEEIYARHVASCSCGDEGASAWLDETRTSCQELLPDGEEEMILRDFNAG